MRAVLAGYLVCYHGFFPDEAISLVRQANPRAMTAPGFARPTRMRTSEGYLQVR